ncbi:MAG TPA: NagC family transcriptional regulator, partial [Lachnospiraceae bacterium]|nr:NagC family transcriptional regulator [Lachnospiraceae bacterium]
IKYPCMFSHDTEAAAFTEIWRRKHTDFLYLTINTTIGGALVIDGKLHNGAGRISGTLEHMCLYPDGKPCYCGRQGCVEAYCSMGALLKDARVATLNEFFSKIEDGNAGFLQIWHNFLRNLAMAINNSIHLIDCDVVLGGLISLFLTDDDIELLQQYICEINSFSFYKPRIYLGIIAENVSAIGAAYHLIWDFLDHDKIFR